MRVLACALIFSVGALFGCKSVATIGGLCPTACTSAEFRLPGCEPVRCDAGVDAAVDTAVDAGGTSAMCAAVSCTPDAGAVCSEQRRELSRMRVDLMLVVDDSISLVPWWPALNDGLMQFVQNTEASGLAVGLQRFDDVCEAESYIDPLVAIAPIADNRQALLQELPFPGTVSTSTTPALDGVLRYARGWAVDNPDSHVAVVLLTDASPGACDGLVGDYDAEAQQLARTAYQGSPSIETYVIGFGPLPGTGPLAVAGGTDPIPIAVTPADGEVEAALERVRRIAQPCAFRWPAGLLLASDSAVVIVASDGTERRVPILSNASACAGQDGFYVADPAASYPLIACATTCESLTFTDQAALSSTCLAP